MKLIKITKLKVSDDPLHPLENWHVQPGYEKQGIAYQDPKVGEVFWVEDFHTSTVQEILSENTFRTHNSIYRWEEIKQQA